MNKLYVNGDSISAYAGASSPAKGYASLLAVAIGRTLVNYGLSTATANDMGAKLYATQTLPGDVGVPFFGTNDENNYGFDAVKRGYFIDTLRAYAVWLSAQTSLANPDNGVSFSGAWSNTGYAYGTYAASAAGSKATFAVEGDSVAIGLIRQYGNTAKFRVRIDGTDKSPVGGFAVGGDVRNLLSAGWPQFGPYALAFSGLGIGRHVVEIEVLTATPQNVAYFHWFSALAPKTRTVLVTIPHALGFYGGSNENIDAYNADIKELHLDLRAMGLDVVIADITPLLSAQNMADGVHPNDSGHKIIADAISAVAVDPVTFTETQVFEGSDGNAYVDIGGIKKLVGTAV